MPAIETPINTQALLGTYQEICKSYHAIDDFRMKLLGLLPLASLVGLFGLNAQSIFGGQTALSNKVMGFIATFATVFTISLLIYEIRGILRCSDLIKRGGDLEDQLGVRGQFWVCLNAHDCKRSDKWVERTRSFLDAKLAACVIYSSVISAWVFTALHFGLGKPIPSCALIAAASGIIMGVCTFLLVRRLVAA